MKLKRYLIIVLIFLTGCSSMAKITRNEAGKVERIVAKGGIEVKVETEGETIFINSKMESPIKDVINFRIK